MGLTILTVGLWSNISFAENFKSGSEPSGFRELPWGTKPQSDMEETTYVFFFPGQGKAYIRKNEYLHLGGAKLEKIVYCFWKDKLYSVLVVTEEGSENWLLLKEAVFEKFGEGYDWEGSETEMHLDYIEELRKGRLEMDSKEIKKQRDAYNKQKKDEEKLKGGF